MQVWEVSSPGIFLHVRFLQVSFFYRELSLLRPLHPLVVFFTFEFLYTIRFLSLTLDDFITRGFLQMFLYRVQTLLPGLYTHFLHVKFPGSFFTHEFLHTTFSLTPDYFVNVGFFTNVFVQSADTSSGSLYAFSTCEFSWGGGR
jgi:hypothetical protein